MPDYADNGTLPGAKQTMVPRTTPSLVCALLIIILALAFTAIPASSAAQSSTAPREVTITAFVDEELFSIYTEGHLKRTVQDIINFISGAFAKEVFEKESPVVFKLQEVKRWSYPLLRQRIYTTDALTDLAQKQHVADIALGFIKAGKDLEICTINDLRAMITELECQKQKGSKKRVGGDTTPTFNIALISLNEDAPYTALHEMAHIFGAEHVESTIMLEDPLLRTTRFDKENREIIKRNRNRKFEKIHIP